jgi:hypothetical protein
MKKKVLKQYAQKIAELERIVNNPDSTEIDIKSAKLNIVNLTDEIFEKSDSVDDFLLVDELIQNELQK